MAEVGKPFLAPSEWEMYNKIAQDARDERDMKYLELVAAEKEEAARKSAGGGKAAAVESVLSAILQAGNARAPVQPVTPNRPVTVAPQVANSTLPGQQPINQSPQPQITVGTPNNSAVPGPNNTTCPTRPTDGRNKAQLIAFVDCTCRVFYKGSTKVNDNGVSCVSAPGAAGYIWGCALSKSGPPTCTSR
jgi:hypothetical protein